MKTLLYLCFTVLTLSLQAQQWEQINDFPDTERFAAMDFVVNGEAYLLGGLILDNTGNYEGFNELWKYSEANDTWSEVGTFPGGARYAGISFVIGDVAYVGLGADENGFQKIDLWAYNTTNGQWSQKANLPAAARSFSYAFASDGKGYIGNGLNWVNGNPSYQNDLWEYNPDTDSWTQRTPYPGGGRVGMVAMEIADYGQVGMGDDGQSFFNEFYGYDPDNDNWVALAPFPGENFSFYATTSYDGKGYLLGGEKGHEVYSTQLWIFDPIADEWEGGTNYPGQATGYANFFTVDDALYYGFGLFGPDDHQATNSWWKLQFEPPSSVAEEVMGNSSLVYPNPTSDVLKVQLEPSERLEEVRLYDGLGRIVYEGREALISMEKLISQHYVLEVITDVQVYRQQVVKN